VNNNHGHTEKTLEPHTLKPEEDGLDLPHVNLMTFRVEELSELGWFGKKK